MKDKLNERLKELDNALLQNSQVLQQAQLNVNMLNGARQEVIHLLNLLDQNEKSEETKEPKCEDAGCVSNHLGSDEEVKSEAA